MMADEQDGTRVKAAEPVGQDASAPGEVSSSTSSEGLPHGVASPSEIAERGDAIDESSAGDGVAFFEGGDGRESARTDIERSG